MARYRRFDVSGSPAIVTSGADAGAPVLSPEMRDVRMRRAGLKAAMSGLELALAAPAPRRVEWVSNLRDSLHALHEVWTRHMVETEAPGAFFDELVSEAPRLSSPASRLRQEHGAILAEIVSAEQQLATPPTEDDGYAEWCDQIRTELTALLVALARHRQRGADLVYQAYDVDIGGGF
jgi:hypothetical protein